MIQVGKKVRIKLKIKEKAKHHQTYYYRKKAN